MKNIETLFPQFQVLNIVRQNTYKKTATVKRSGHNYMLRIFSLEGISKDKVQSIIQILTKLSTIKNPYICKFYEASFDQEMTYLGIVSEYIEKSINCSVDEEDIWNIIVQICQALQLFHPNKIHGKLAISNIFQCKTGIILGEMNILYYLHKINYQDIYLLAPEFIKNQIYDYKSDIWMFGYVLYQLMFKEPAIIANNVDVLHKKILKGIQLTYNPNYSLNLNNLLRLMLCYDPELRPNVEQIVYYCEQAHKSKEEININKIFPKFKVDKVVLHKKRTEKKPDPIDNVVYLSEDHYRQPLFPPSKIKRLKKGFLSKQVTSLFDIAPQSSSAYTLSLPKVLNYKYNKNYKQSEQSNSEKRKEMQEKRQITTLEFEPLQPPQQGQAFSTQRKSPTRLHLKQELQNQIRIQRQLS